MENGNISRKMKRLRWICEESSVTLLQNDPMTKLLKVLVAIGVFLTAPLQVAYLYFSEVKWDNVIPFRIKATLNVLGETTCNITIAEGSNAVSATQA